VILVIPPEILTSRSRLFAEYVKTCDNQPRADNHRTCIHDEPTKPSKAPEIFHICGFLINDSLSADDQPIQTSSVYFKTRGFTRAEDSETLSNDTELAAWVFPHEQTTDLACPLKSVKLRKVDMLQSSVTGPIIYSSAQKLVKVETTRERFEEYTVSTA
jgi:hypothetical protein